MNKLFFIFCIIVFLFKTQTVFSNNLIYDVNNIEVSGKINNDLDQKKLIEEAFKKAFIIFINKTLLSEDVKVLHKTKIEVIQDLIFTYQIVNNERIILMSKSANCQNQKCFFFSPLGLLH